ncbi:MAG: hypothetical protein H7Z37_14210, partial [Pyrinomonadaceae bacterium]|nr:hypothetical protein [Pyrinomonadaceae bacterium]
MLETTLKTLYEIAKDVRDGLLETVGVESSLVVEGKCSIKVEVPENADVKIIASAIDA